MPYIRSFRPALIAEMSDIITYHGSRVSLNLKHLEGLKFSGKSKKKNPSAKVEVWFFSLGGDLKNGENLRENFEERLDRVWILFRFSIKHSNNRVSGLESPAP